MRIWTIINAWHLAKNKERDYLQSDSVSFSSFRRAARQVITFRDAIDRRIELVEPMSAQQIESIKQIATAVLHDPVYAGVESNMADCTLQLIDEIKRIKRTIQGEWK